MKVYQPTDIDDPVQPEQIANKRYVDNASSASPIFFTDVTPTSTGIIGSKTYIPGTIPVNVIVDAVTTDTNTVDVVLLAEGPSTFYSPTITLTGVPALIGEPVSVTLTEDPSDKRLFHGLASIEITADTVVTAMSGTGSSALVTITQAPPAPSIASFVVDPLPTSGVTGQQQTHAKLGDLLSVTGIVSNDATLVTVNGFGNSMAANLTTTSFGVNDSAGVGFKTFTGNLNIGTGNISGNPTAFATNSFGTDGPPVASSNILDLDQTFPIIAPPSGQESVLYNGGQTAAKDGETVDINLEVTAFDQILYTSTPPGITLTNSATLYEALKELNISTGTNQVGVVNASVTAYKYNNDSVATYNVTVDIINLAPVPVISIVGNPTSLRSSPTGEVYTVNFVTDVPLGNAPSMTATSGTLSPSWTGSGTSWSTTLTISDNDLKGLQEFDNVNVTTASALNFNVVNNTIPGYQYTIAGFTQRVISFAAFQQASDLGTFVVDPSKLVASYQDSSDLTFQANLNDTPLAFSIADRINDDTNALYDPNNRYFWINDVAFAGSNTSGTLSVVVEETL